MKFHHFYPTVIMGCTTLLLCTACTADEENTLTKEGQTLTFRLAARETAASTTPRLTRLYLAERLAEHTPQEGNDAEFLHCAPYQRFWIFKNIYSLSGLKGQWYKFAFADVPNLADVGKDIFEVEKESGYDAEHNFNLLTLDFTPILNKQENLNEAQKEDLSIYRNIEDRWVHPSNPNFEDISLTRITGEWVVDMGIPEEQFPYEIRQFTLQLKGYTRSFYLHDEADNEVILKKDHMNTENFVWTVNSQTERQIFHITLLPGDYEEANVYAQYEDTNQNLQTLQIPLVDKNKQKITTKANTRTHLLYNGMEQDEFEIRYAGFSNSSITVGPDDWNGVN